MVLISSAIVGLVILCIYLYRKTLAIQSKLSQTEVEFEKERSDIRIDAKKRSGAVQWGLAIENFVPFMDEFPLRPEDVNFLGKPIDYIGYKNTGSKTKCEVHFIEVKSGNAFLLPKQKNIKKAIQEGRVYWHEVRVQANKKVDS
tara:strand:- start:268 stop:699 length:432 start_codon:yes stop_codon:yes gene_type:complete